ncbi:MAG: hypothetical protein ACI9V8_001545 [Urechidicola sp.]|jgi:hypothetical protein
MNCFTKLKFPSFIILVFFLIPNANSAETFPFYGIFNPINEAGYSIKISGDGQERILSITDLEKLPLHTANFAFGDINGLRGDFVGIKLIDLLNHIGITTFNRLIVRSSDNYKITIENNDPGIENAILASRLNGEHFPLDSKGPFFIIWPDQAEDLLNGKIAGVKWAWSVVAIRKIK